MSALDRDDRSGEFYVGYLPEAPPGVASFVRRVTVLALVLLVLAAFGVVASQSAFSPSRFEFGELREVRGVLRASPVPMLRVAAGDDVHGRRVHRHLLLVAPGKFGAASLLEGFEERVGRPLAEVEATLRGTLIYHDGKALLELSEGEEALVGFEPRSSPVVESTLTDLGPTTVTGEIVDSKCYFGVMKPGLGKPHRSCAVRCLSGGIPPVLMMRNDEGDADYLVLTGPDLEPIHDRVLDYVAEPVEIEGRLSQVEDWLFLRVDPSTGIRRR